MQQQQQQHPASVAAAFPSPFPSQSLLLEWLWVVQGSDLHGEGWNAVKKWRQLGQWELLAQNDTRTCEKHQAASILRNFSGTSHKLWAKGGSLLGVTGTVKRRRRGEQSNRHPGSEIGDTREAGGLWDEGPGFIQPL